MRSSLAVVVVAALLLPACGLCAITCPTPCGPDTLGHARSETVVLDSGLQLARFDFQQTVTVYNGDNCPANSSPTGTVSLSITNLTGETSFAYTVTGSGEPAWSYSGTVSHLPAGATLDLGVIAHSMIRVDLGAGPRIVLAGPTLPSTSSAASR